MAGFGDELRVNLEEITIPYTVALRINSLVEAHRKSGESPSNQELLFRYLMRTQPAQGYSMNTRLVRDFENTREWFMKRTHLRAEAMPEDEEADLQRQFAAFEAMLHSFVGSFFTTVKKLDDLLQQANQRSD